LAAYPRRDRNDYELWCEDADGNYQSSCLREARREETRHNRQRGRIGELKKKDRASENQKRMVVN
jgi:hypothetical protein